MARRFTKRELLAISEALSSRLAGEIDIHNEPGAPRHEDYESAWSKVLERLPADQTDTEEA